MTQDKPRDEVTREDKARCCGGRKEGRPACRCSANGCPEKARWVCLAALIGGLGFLAIKIARRSTGPAGPGCCGGA